MLDTLFTYVCIRIYLLTNTSLEERVTLPGAEKQMYACGWNGEKIESEKYWWSLASEILHQKPNIVVWTVTTVSHYANNKELWFHQLGWFCNMHSLTLTLTVSIFPIFSLFYNYFPPAFHLQLVLKIFQNNDSSLLDYWWVYWLRTEKL